MQEASSTDVRTRRSVSHKSSLGHGGGSGSAGSSGILVTLQDSVSPALATVLENGHEGEDGLVPNALLDGQNLQVRAAKPHESFHFLCASVHFDLMM